MQNVSESSIASRSLHVNVHFNVSVLAFYQEVTRSSLQVSISIISVMTDQAADINPELGTHSAFCMQGLTTLGQ